ncbi:Imm52 family immunity protein [Streptomyces chartreusis]
MGPRKEAPLGLAGRLEGFLQRLQEISGGTLIHWHTAEDGDIALDSEALADYIVAANPESDAKHMGYTTSLWAQQTGVMRVEVSTTVGGTAEYTGNRIVVTARPAGDSSPAGLAWMASNALAALAEEWEPDWGDVSDEVTRKAVQTSNGIRRSDPRCGYAVYLSSGRREMVPMDFPRQRTPTRDEGLVIVLPAASGGFAAVEDVVSLDARLRRAGALDKLSGPHGSLQVVSMRLSLKYPAAAASGPRFAADIVAAARAVSEVDLDYSVASLTQVDEMIESIRSDGPPFDAVAETLFDFGAYVGKVLVRHADAQWVNSDDSARQLFVHAFGVATSTGQLLNPLGKAFARYVNGAEDSPYYCRAVFTQPCGARLRCSPPFCSRSTVRDCDREGAPWPATIPILDRDRHGTGGTSSFGGYQGRGAGSLADAVGRSRTPRSARTCPTDPGGVASSPTASSTSTAPGPAFNSPIRPRTSKGIC